MPTVEIVRNIDKPNTGLMKKPDFSPAPLGRIAQVFLNVNLRRSHDGLLEIAKKRGIDLNEFPRGSYLVFINEVNNRFKLMTPATFTKDGLVIDWLIAYYKSPRGRIDLNTIYNIPKIFSGRGTLDLASSADELLREQLKMKRIRTVKQIAAEK